MVTREPQRCAAGGPCSLDADPAGVRPVPTMPRRKPTPARGRRAVASDTAPRKRKPTPISTAALAEAPAPLTALVLSGPATPAVAAPEPPRPVLSHFLPPSPRTPTIEPDLETRDTRPFRERVLSRRGSVGLLLFRLGNETFAAELGAVEEAVEVPELHDLPEMQTGMLGMFDLRGKLLPVFSAAGVLGVTLAPGSMATLILRGAGRRIGIAVDDVDDVIDADCSFLRNPPAGLDPDGVLLAVLQRGTALASVIDASALVAACLATTPEIA